MTRAYALRAAVVGLLVGVLLGLFGLTIYALVHLDHDAQHIQELALANRQLNAANALANCKLKFFDVVFALETRRARANPLGTSYNPHFVHVIDRKLLPVVRSIPSATICPAIKTARDTPQQRATIRRRERAMLTQATITTTSTTSRGGVKTITRTRSQTHNFRGPRGPRGPRGFSTPLSTPATPAARSTPTAQDPPRPAQPSAPAPSAPAQTPQKQGPLGLPCVLGVLCH